MFRTGSRLLFVCLLLTPFLDTSARIPGIDRPTIRPLSDLAQPKRSCCGSSPNIASLFAFAPEGETYKLTATYYSLQDNLTTTLMLNNKGSQPVLAVPTIYSLSGTRLNLAPITVPAASYIDVDMHQLVADTGEEFREGSIKISYEGGNQQLGAQVKMIDAANNLIWAEHTASDYTRSVGNARTRNNA